nr:MAG TPA: hypothetical protein [Caudoviricetes sp.]
MYVIRENKKTGEKEYYYTPGIRKRKSKLSKIKRLANKITSTQLALYKGVK